MSTRKTRKTATRTTNDVVVPEVNYANALTRFDLENAIMQCWNTCDDIDLIAKLVADDDFTLANADARDRVVNALIGLKELHSLRFNALFDTFSELVAAREFRSDANVDK